MMRGAADVIQRVSSDGDTLPNGHRSTESSAMHC